MRSQLREVLAHAVEKTAKAEGLNPDELPPIVLEPPRQREFGDLSSNIAMVWARSAKRPPRSIAEAVLRNLEDPDGILTRQEIAGPGFLNFSFAPKFFFREFRALVAGRNLQIDVGHGSRLQVEFASVNPTGPLHVGHGRVAVIGDALARLHQAAGFSVEREYYVNDAGNQMDNLGLSIEARYRESFGEEIAFPENGYPGEYIKEIAADIRRQEGDKYLHHDSEAALNFFRQTGGDALLNVIRRQLSDFDISFDSFFSEKAMRERGEVTECLEILRQRGLVYCQDGAEWYKSTQFGDDKDRTVVKSDGELTYFASDIAYHRNKYQRGFRKLINVWGADHHGYVARLNAAMQGLGYDPNLLHVVLVQMVQLTRGGEPVRMGKRSGEFISLEEVLDEVGRDAARFFFLMRKSDSHLDFDLDLAKRQSSDNPVFYVQYAHARVASIFEQAARNGIILDQRDKIPIERLVLSEELGLIRRMIEFNDVLEESVRELEPHRMIFYLLDLAGEFHHYYNHARVITEDADLSRARLLLIENVQKTVRRGLEILGIDAPTKMAARSEADQ
jgi:arginyl-tRNA synthetase